MGKSEFSSYLFPAYFLGKFPQKKVIMGTHTASLSEDFGRRIRNLIDTEDYKAIFPGTTVAEDQKASGKWSTAQGGQYYAVGVGGSIAGRGADLFVIDDPHSEQDMKTGSATPFHAAWNWFQTGPLQRLMPGGAIIVIMTRWSQIDLTGMLINHQIKNPDADKWEIVELPAILHENTPEEKSLWPEQWPLDQLQAKRAGMDPRFWQAQYMQNPTSEVAAIIKREQWRIWEHEEPPKCEYIIQSWDTAHETKTTSDYSACTTWGVWFNEEDNDNAHIILLDAIKGRWAFPDLKRRALEYYKEWEPDSCLIEKKAAGAPLIQELRAMGVPISEFSPSRAKLGSSNDKVVRLNAVADMFTSGRVWIPDTRWAREVVEEVAAFPAGEHDDYVDTCFVGSTPVLMGDNSTKALADIRVGDVVATPSGPRRVTAFWDKGEREVWNLTVGDRTVQATADHLMYTQRGWIPIDRLIPVLDTVAHAKQRSLAWPLKAIRTFWSKVSNSRDGRTAATQKAKIPRTDGISVAVLAACTALFGRFTTVLFPLGGMYTTSTATPQTIAPRTLHAYRLLSTHKNTAVSAALAVAQQRICSTWTRYVKKLKRGTEAKRAAHGTEKMPKSLLPKPWLLKKQKDCQKSPHNALGVAHTTSPTAGAAPTAHPHARLQNLDFVAVSHIQNTHTMQRVYDIEVEDAHCFYANNLLAHNCTQALMRVRQGGFIRLPSDQPDEPKLFRSVRRAAFY
jgi:predicted phage terminase large subunit-like protein